jgi:hypothetical protein
VDIQCASQALESLALYGEADAPACLDIGERVAGWTIAHMQDPDGHFYYRSRLGIWVNRTPMLHWGQTTMLHGLAALLLARRSRAPASGAQATAREEPGA